MFDIMSINSMIAGYLQDMVFNNLKSDNPSSTWANNCHSS